MEGWMWKKGAAKALAVGGTFKRRWFKMQFLVVANDSGSKSKCLALTYFKSPEHAAEGAKRLLGHVNLSSATSIDEAGPSALNSDKVAAFRRFGFHVVTPKRTWVLAPESAQELHKWVAKMWLVFEKTKVSRALVEAAREMAGLPLHSDTEAPAGSGGGTDQAEKKAQGGTAAGESSSSSDGGSDLGGDASSSDDDGGRQARRDRGGAQGRGRKRQQQRQQRGQGKGQGRSSHGRRRSSAASSAALVRARAEVQRLTQELEAAQVTISELRRQNVELVDRLEMRNLDSKHVLGLEDPLLAGFGLGKAGQKRSINARLRRGTDPDEDFDEHKRCCCVVM